MSKMGYNSSDKNFFERIQHVSQKQNTFWKETQCTKQPQFAAPAISPVTHECSISAKLHYVAGTTGVEVSHPALTCVLQLYERVSASATNFPAMENRDTHSFLKGERKVIFEQQIHGCWLSGSSWKGSERIESTRLWNKALVQKERLKRNSRILKILA